MEKKLSTFQKGKVVLGLIEDLKNLPNKNAVYMNPHYSDAKLMKKIAERAGIKVTDWMEKGVVDIADDVSVALDTRIEDTIRKLNGEPRYSSSFGRDIEFGVEEKLKEAVDEFEKKNIPSSGPCNTHLGEIFRAIQYIQYRAFNDGDLAWDPGSPSFMSYIYLRSQIDDLNYSKFAYNNESGEYTFEFTDPFLSNPRYDWGQISDVIEDSLAKTADYIKYQIMDLLLNGKIEDRENEFDSRDFRKLKEDRYW